MLWQVLIFAGAVAVGAGLWYILFRRYNRRRSQQALRWIETAFEGHGRVAGVYWRAPSCFQVKLRLGQNPFQHASVVVQLAPRERPLRWLAARWRRVQETLTFESDLDIPPEFDLEVQNHRWFGRTRRHFPRTTNGWHLERSGAFLITTRREWQRELAPSMDALMASRERDFVAVTYRRTSPHFSATLPLDALASSAACADFFEVLREVAGGASARNSN